MKKFKIRILIIMALVFLFAFFVTSRSNVKESIESSKPISEFKPSKNVPTMEQIVTTLCSDEFEGRQTFSNGNEKAGEYIANVFGNIGLNPLSENSYFQKYTQNGVNNDYNSYKRFKTL